MICSAHSVAEALFLRQKHSVISLAESQLRKTLSNSLSLKDFVRGRWLAYYFQFAKLSNDDSKFAANDKGQLSDILVSVSGS